MRSTPEIAIDARFLSSGLGTYAFNVLKSLDSRGQLEVRAVTRTENIQALKPYCDTLRVVNAEMYSASEQVLMALAARGADLFHATHYNVPIAHRGKLLVTIHDLTHIVDKAFIKTAKSVLYAQPMLRFAAHRAAHVITVSEYSKRNIVRFLKVPERKISVIPNGVGADFHAKTEGCSISSARDAFGVDGPYILFLGNLKPHKNVDGLLRAFKILCDKNDFEHKLLIGGDDAVGRPALTQLAADLNLTGKVVFAGRIEQSQIPDLYRAATITVLPSFEEGFGLPVLESMACGTPVACSQAASIPEVAGDAVEYFDPSSPDSIASSMERLLSSSDLRADLVKRGLQRSKQFSWQANGAAHLAIYKALTA